MLSQLLSPRSVALVGASAVPGKLGYDILSNLKHLGYQGKIFPVNSKGGVFLGLPVFPDIESLPEIPDVVLIAIPAPFVLPVVESCGKKGIRNIVVITAGFKEIGGEGAEREQKLQELIQQYDLCVVGPNCLGVIDTNIQMNASFAEGMPARGNVSLISQSGAMAVAIIDWAYESGLGFSKIISMGNKAGVTETELLEHLGSDENTKVILLYLESIAHGERFLEIARSVSLKKPIIAIKSGTSEAGTKAISSHTGSLAGSDTAVSTAFAQAGIIRANTVEELFDYAKIFSYQHPPKGNRIGIITNAGGPGIMATDAVEKTDLQLVPLSEETKKKLAEGLPETAALGNPVDVIGDAPASRYRHAVNTLLESDDIDSLLVMLTPQVMTEVKRVASLTTALSHQYSDKTVLSAFMGGESIERGEKVFRRHLFPNYSFPERAVFALDRMWKYAEWQKAELSRIEVRKGKEASSPSPELVRLFSQKKSGDRLSGKEIEMLMEAYGIPGPRVHLATTADEAVSLAQKITYPVVMKIASPQIYHKTDAGGIRIDVATDEDVQKFFGEIVANAKAYDPSAEIHGVTVEPMVPIGKEVIIGVRKDPQFGHLLMFGLGGIYVEILKDVTFRVAPIERQEAMNMIGEIKAIQILKGARGEKPVDLNSIADIIEKVSRIVTDFPQISEMEINPLIVSQQGGVMAVDTNCIVE